jgi:hypothetical protein
MSNASYYAVLNHAGRPVFVSTEPGEAAEYMAARAVRIATGEIAHDTYRGAMTLVPVIDDAAPEAA